MQPVHDVDALLLMAVSLSSKRRPAELVDIMAAIDLLQGAIPSEAKLVEAFARLAVHGLISEQDGGFTLPAEAEKIMTGQPKKGETPERLFCIKEKLAAYNPAGGDVPIRLAAEQLTVAIAAYRSAAASSASNLLLPKPKPVEEKKPFGAKKSPGGRLRKPVPVRRRKA